MTEIKIKKLEDCLCDDCEKKPVEDYVCLCLDCKYNPCEEVCRYMK